MFELQAEAAASQLRSFSLPDDAGRHYRAQRDSIAGGPKQTGRIQDTHFLGSKQWEYCRALAKLATPYNESIEQYILTNKVGARNTIVQNLDCI